MKENNRKCICCGKEYKYCGNCSAYDNLPKWMSIYHDANCREIFIVTSDYLAGDISKEEAIDRLDKCDLSNKASFHEKIKATIDELYGVQKSVVTLDEEVNSTQQVPKMARRKTR